MKDKEDATCELIRDKKETKKICRKKEKVKKGVGSVYAEHVSGDFFREQVEGQEVRVRQEGGEREREKDIKMSFPSAHLTTTTTRAMAMATTCH